MYKSKWLSILLLIIFGTGIYGVASAESAKKYHQHPYWIEMMKDPNVNYFEACKAYDAFWKGRIKPRGEEDIIGQQNDVNAGADKDHYKSERRERKEKQQDADLQKYAFDCKKFENWKRQNAPYVKSDGHLMTSDERLKVWQQQRGK